MLGASSSSSEEGADACVVDCQSCSCTRACLHWSWSKHIPQISSAQESSLLTVVLHIMPSTGSSLRLGLGVLKAKFLQKKGALREDHKKMRKLLAAIKQKEQELDDMEESRSSSFSSGSPLLEGSGSESEKEDSAADSSSKTKGPSVPMPKGKALVKAPPPKAEAHPPPPATAPVVVSKAPGAPKAAKAAGNKGKPEGHKGRERRPFIPPGEPAPDHRGKANASGEYYPGFPQGDPRHCQACEQLRRGFWNATRPHRPKAGVCAWAPLAGKP